MKNGTLKTKEFLKEEEWNKLIEDYSVENSEQYEELKRVIMGNCLKVLKMQFMNTLKTYKRNYQNLQPEPLPKKF